MSSSVTPALWRPADVAKYLAISRPAVYRYIERGSIRSVKIAGSVRVPHVEVMRLAEEGMLS